ncbi:MAG TPA: hypothetical protein VF488_03195, partial [Gemmatimonadaceae bacterium]
MTQNDFLAESRTLGYDGISVGRVESVVVSRGRGSLLSMSRRTGFYVLGVVLAAAGVALLLYRMTS